MNAIAQQPLWFKTRVFRCGDKLKAVTNMVVDGNPRVLRFELDMPPLIDRLGEQNADRVARLKLGKMIGREIQDVTHIYASGNNVEVGGFDLIRDVISPVKKVVSSPFAKVGAGVLSAVFPPVGAAAMTALKSAETGLGAIESVDGVVKQIKGAGKKLKAGAPFMAELAKLSPKKRKQYLAQHPQAQAAVMSLAEARRKIALAKKNKRKILAAKKKAERTRAAFKKIAAESQYSQDPARRDRARKLAEVVKIAARARERARLAAAKAQEAEEGLYFDERGRVARGRFRPVAHGKKGFFYRSGESQSGEFAVQLPTEVSEAQKAREEYLAAKRAVEDAKKSDVTVKAYITAKQEADDALAAYDAVRKGARVKDLEEARAVVEAVKRADAQGMEASAQARLKIELTAKARENKRSRAAALKRTRTVAKQKLREEKALRKSAKKAAAQKLTADLKLKRAERKQERAQAKDARKQKKVDAILKLREERRRAKEAKKKARRAKSPAEKRAAKEAARKRLLAAKKARRDASKKKPARTMSRVQKRKVKLKLAARIRAIKNDKKLSRTDKRRALLKIKGSLKALARIKISGCVGGDCAPAPVSGNCVGADCLDSLSVDSSSIVEGCDSGCGDAVGREYDCVQLA